MTRIELTILILTTLPLIQATVSYPLNFSLINHKQFLTTLMLDSLAFTGFYATRSLPSQKNEELLKSIFILTLISGVIVILQQLDLISQLYPSEYLANFRDSNNEVRYRNTGFYGNWHDAGLGLSILTLLTMSINHSFIKSKLAVYFVLLFSLTALIYTSARAEIILTILTIILVQLSILKKYQFEIILVICMLVIMYFSHFFDNTLLSGGADSLNFVENEGRIGAAIKAISYLSGDTWRFLFGWGLGSAGVAVVEGEPILPINAVDNTFIIIIANYGVIGLIARLLLVSHLLKLLINELKKRRCMPKDSFFDINLFSVFLVIYLIISFALGEAIINKIYLGITSLVIGMIVRINRQKSRI